MLIDILQMLFEALKYVSMRLQRCCHFQFNIFSSPGVYYLCLCSSADFIIIVIIIIIIKRNI